MLDLVVFVCCLTVYKSKMVVKANVESDVFSGLETDDIQKTRIEGHFIALRAVTSYTLSLCVKLPPVSHIRKLYVKAQATVMSF